MGFSDQIAHRAKPRISLNESLSQWGDNSQTVKMN